MKIVKERIIEQFQDMKMSKRPVGLDDWRFMITNVSDPIWFGLGWSRLTGNFWIFSIEDMR